MADALVAASVSSYAAQCARLLDEATPEALEAAAVLARSCIRANSNDVEGYLLLGKALALQDKHRDAVTWYKKDPANGELQSELHAARLAVLDRIANGGDTSEDEDERDSWHHRAEADRLDRGAGTVGSLISASFENKEGTTTLSAEQRGALVFEENVEKLLKHLDLTKLSRLATLYVLTELLNLKRVRIGLALLVLGVLGQCVMHRHKFMVASIIFMCVYQSKMRLIVWRQVNTWAHTSTDKLGAFTWAPRIVCFVPIAMKVFGHMKFMAFLQRDLYLGMWVFLVTAACVWWFTFRQGCETTDKVWGQGKRLKLVAYATAIFYWGVWRGEVVDTLRLLPPALIDAGGIALGSVTSTELQGVFRNAWKQLYADVESDIQQDVEFDAWFMLGLSNWFIEYWQQPTNFSLEMLTQMLSECFSVLERTAVHVFRPELGHWRQQMAHLRDENSEMAVLIAYLRKSVDEMPPPKTMSMIGLFVKRCPSFVVAALLVVFYGTIISLPLVPFLVSEWYDACVLYAMHKSGDLEELDGFEILLLESPLLRVWENVKAAVYCLEGSVTLSKAMATGTQIVTAAARLSRLATFAVKLKTEGVVAHAHNLPDHLTDALLVAKDSTGIVEGLKHVVQSAHFQDLQASIVNWWHKTPPE
uniref:Uncharacterized protein n=1 Tax=Globisporangium ultimum (strain ATCC 200006 / CBS 805.95 / DAOM BR144) TaxID=431595 RepID=K3W6K3_GLOUD